MPRNVTKRFVSRISRMVTGKLANKLILILLPSVTVFIVLLILISYLRTTDTLKTDFVENNKNILKLVIQNFDNYMEQVDEFSLTPRMDVAGRFMKLLTQGNSDYESDSYIDEQIVNMFNSRQDVEELSLYLPSGSRVKTISRASPKIRNLSGVGFEQTSWYREATRGIHYRCVESSAAKAGNGPNSGKRSILFTFYRALINIPDQKPLGVVAVSFNSSQVTRMFRTEYLQNGEIMFIFDKTNELMYSSDTGFHGVTDLGAPLRESRGSTDSGSFSAVIGDRNYLAVYTNSDNLEWKAVKLIPINLLNEKVRETRNLSLLFGILFIVAFALIIIFASNLITGSLRRLSRQMDKVGSGDFKIKADVKGHDEIAHLAGTFNGMVEQLDELVNEKYRAQISIKTARLKALEAQINPHFIYNSLQAISTKAVLGGMKDISRMLEALAYNLRYSIKGGDMVKVSNEIEHIGHYLILHKARFEERLSVEILVEDGIQDIVVPKLSIHTLVENSIKHCLELMTESIHIRIHAFSEDNHITISVSDDGPGMTPERLQQVLAELEDPQWLDKPEESIGLKNLNARLKLLYGNETFLVIQSSPNIGTAIKIVLPQKIGA